MIQMLTDKELCFFCGETRKVALLKIPTPGVEETPENLERGGLFWYHVCADCMGLPLSEILLAVIEQEE